MPANQFTAAYEVISPEIISHVLEHPARGERWPLAELAQVIGVSRQWLGHLRTGRSTFVSAPVAQQLADAVGVHINVLFRPRASTDSNNNGQAA
ncbi:MAG TPA: helix-turn-helix transcriptional regulator [Aeromicrobium sp.]|nr:helix-turn-helix transcriptional regulator [Aeromicrobium sp.]